VCGFPCQAFSPAGLQRGTVDPNGQVCFAAMEAIAHCLPTAFVLENVSNIKRFPELLSFIVETLRSLRNQAGDPEYEVHWEIMDSAKHGGVPQHRERLFIVGIASRKIRNPFRWPVPVRMKRLDEVLSDVQGSCSLIDSMSATKKKNLHIILSKYQAATSDIVADLGARTVKVMHDVCPCLTASRAGDSAVWTIKRCRPLSITELMRIQGFDPVWLRGYEDAMSHRQMGTALGNAMTATVLQRILRQVFLALGWQVKPDTCDDLAL